MTPAQLTQLKSELQTDPLAIGYAPYVTAGNDNECAALINALTGPGAATITIPSYSSDAFATGILPAVMALGAATTALQTKWQYVLQTALSRQLIQYAAASPLLSALVADGLLTSAQVTAFTTRIGGRAEFLWGAGTQVSPVDVMHCFGRGL